MKTSLNLSHGSAKSSSPHHQIFKNGKASSKNEQISKYLVTNNHTIEDVTKSQSSDNFDSPYKKSLSQIKIMSCNDDPSKDFRTPKPIKVQKTSRNKKPAPLRQSKLKSSFSKSKSTINKNSIFKATQDNFGLSDVNPEHLQMALALSKSTYAVEYPELSKDAEDALPNFLTPEKIPKGKSTLERYGFKSDKPKLHAELKREPIELPKRNKNSKFRFITPTLKTRTVEERESIIATKISMILCRNNESYEESQEAQNFNELYSDILKKFKTNCSLFAANAFSLEDENYKYYKESLNISPPKYKCGCLLKKWEDIPGREKSPIRGRLESEHDSKINSNNTDMVSVNSSQDRLKLSLQFNSKRNNETFSNTNNKDWEDIPGREKSPIRGRLESEQNNFNNTDTISVNSSQDSIKLNMQFNNKRKNGTFSNSNSSSTTVSNNLFVEYSTNRDCISPDLFESESESEYMPKSPDTLDDFSQSLLSPSKKRPISISQASSLETILKYPSFNTDDSDLKLVEEISQKSLSSTKRKNNASSAKNILECSEDEDTEVLYINSLKEKVELEISLTQDSLSTNSKTSPEVKISHLNFEVVDLTFSSDDDSSSHYSSVQIGNKQTTNEIVAIESSEKIPAKNSGDSDTNFEMSPLYLKESGNIFEPEKATDFSSAFSEESTSLHNVEHNRQSKSSCKISFGLDGFDCNTTLNVTDYVTQILNQNESKVDENNCDTECSGTKTIDSPSDNLEDFREESDLKSSSQDESNGLTSNQESCSIESIVISDEELNYSSMHSENAKTKNFYELSDAEEISENNGVNTDLMDIDEVYSVHSALKNKYKRISTPVHNRISELRGNSPLTKVSLTTALDDSFNDLLENSNILNQLENEANEKVTVGPSPVEITENQCTPEKVLAVPKENVTTPENNLIIKTNNVTPLTNYDEMDTPGITKELQKFGLKPLKRQRGAKLLKYLYESTHPLVGPDEIEELSSDEDSQKTVPKKRRKSSNTKRCNINSAEVGGNFLKCDQSNIEIVGDVLLKNEDYDELIFERKFSVRIHSCRIPLQIVWHNFLSQNADIKENILLYEPLQLEVLHTMIKEQTGCKFHIQDLLTFFDKKCITIRTAQGSQRKPKF